jgi:hypothetical protein
VSDTPRTDAVTEHFYNSGVGLRSGSFVEACVARTLERDLNAEKVERVALAVELAQRTAERDEANSRLAVSMEAHQKTILGPVAVLLRNLTLTREAAGCRDGDNLTAFVGNMRTMIDAVYAMGYEWRWTKSIDADGEQVGAWVMRDAAEADANNERFRRTDGE